MNTAQDGERWIAQAAAGSDQAFARLVGLHQQAVRAFLRRLCGNRADADDLAQEVFLAAWTHLNRFDRSRNFKVWLCGIAYRKYLEGRRSFWRRLKREQSPDPADAAGFPAPSPALLDLRKAMATLPPEQRAVAALCLAADWSHSEAAEALGLPLGTVKSHVQRGRVTLQQFLSSYAPPERATP